MSRSLFRSNTGDCAARLLVLTKNFESGSSRKRQRPGIQCGNAGLTRRSRFGLLFAVFDFAIVLKNREGEFPAQKIRLKCTDYIVYFVFVSNIMKLSDRTSGILLHLSSLPGSSCCGDLGQGARDFADFLQAAGQSWWQMLPINPIDGHHSPYASVSAFAGEPIYIDNQALVEDGLLDPEDVDWQPNGPLERAAFSAARDYRKTRRHKAFERFHNKQGGAKYRAAYEEFMEENRSWVMPHAIFCSLAEDYGTFNWTIWPDEKIRKADPLVLEQVCIDKEERIAYHVFLQLLFDVQWKEFRNYCRERKIGLIGDVPIYVGMSSADTWANSRLFQLDEFGRMERVAGVPADSFNPDGQRWNSPLYRWEKHKEENYQWWLTRIRTCLRRFDALRLDHFIGFYNYFSMPPAPDRDDPGAWIPGPADDFFDTVLTEFPRTAFIAEDLGVMNAGVHALRDKYGFPRMNVFQFSFDYRKNTDLAKEWTANSIVCTGTHDTTTLAAWFEELLEDRKKPEPFWDFEYIFRSLKRYVPGTSEHQKQLTGMQPVLAERWKKLSITASGEISRDSLRWAIIQTVLDSPGNVAIFPMQDLLGLDRSARMNFPGHAEGNWTWRLDRKYLTGELAHTLGELTACFQRNQS